MKATTTAVLVERRGDVVHVTLDRPAKLNAVLPDDIAALRAAMELDTDVRAVVFSGNGGRAFTAGMHVDAFGVMEPATARAFIGEVRDFMRSVRTSHAISICAVDGYCLGIGFELALACDLRIATTRSSFGLPEIKVGVPSVIDAQLLQQYVGLSLAKEMILTGDVYPLDTVRASGLCNDVVEPAELGAATERMLARVTGHTRAVVASQKRLFEIWQNTTLVDGIDASVEEFGEVFASAETHDHVAGYGSGLGSTTRTDR